MNSEPKSAISNPSAVLSKAGIQITDETARTGLSASKGPFIYSRRSLFRTALAVSLLASTKSLANPLSNDIGSKSKNLNQDRSAKMNAEQIEKTLKGLAEGFKKWPNAPILHRPDEAGLKHEEVFFPSEDGVPLEGWYIPRPGSQKVIIANHPRWFNRSGLPSHLEPWKSFGASAGNDFEVNFVPDYKILHEAGYNVLAYDMRNHGHSGKANDNVFSVGRYESRDVIGSLAYIRTRKDTRDMTIGLFSRCVGGNATFFAMSRHPEVFRDVKCLVSPQPLSSGVALERALERLGIPASYLEKLDQAIQLQTSFTIDQFSPVPWAKAVTIPTFLYQVKDDAYTRPSDIQAMYDNIPVAEKKLYWIEGTTRRWDGYAYFQRDPKQMLEWFHRFMA